MATQTIQFDSLPTADLDGSIAAYVIDGSDTALASLTESSLAGRWTGTLTDHTAGDFELIVSDDSGIIAMYWVRLLATTGTYIAGERGDLISETINGKLTTERLALIDGAMQTGADGDTGETLSDQLDVIELISGSPSPNEIIITASNFGQDGETLLLKEGSSESLAFSLSTAVPADFETIILGISDDAGRTLTQVSGAISVDRLTVTVDIPAANAKDLWEGSHRFDVFCLKDYNSATGAYTDARIVVSGPVEVEPAHVRLEPYANL